MKKSTALLCSFFSGLFLCCAFPPLGFGFCAFVALLPMFYIIQSSNPRNVFFYSWFSGIVFLGLSLSWIRNITWVGMILAVIVLAFFYALPFVLAALIRELSPKAGLAIFPFAVAGMEWIRSFDQLAFPWMALGNSQTYYPWLIQFADITSVYGVSFWIVTINLSIYLLIKKRSISRGVFLALLFLLPFVYSRIVMLRNDDNGRAITVALIQGNVFPEQKWASGLEEWNINLYLSMSVDAMSYNPDLIVWPETATPVYLADMQYYREKVQTLVDSLGVPVLTGMPSKDWDTGESWNAAGLFIPGEKEIQRYRKIHLVPFGEAFPLDELFPALRNIDFGQANWDEGTETVVFTSNEIPPFNIAICFESIFPDLIRKFIVKGSQFIIVITNDVWFGPYASPIQHTMISVMRAIEFHRPVIRCANTGISMIIDSHGRVLEQTGTFVRTMLSGNITPSYKQTIYCKFGNLFSFLAFLVSIVSFIVYIFVKYKNKKKRI